MDRILIFFPLYDTLWVTNYFPTDWLHIIPVKSIKISISIFKIRKLIKITQGTGNKAHKWQYIMRDIKR